MLNRYSRHLQTIFVALFLSIFHVPGSAQAPASAEQERQNLIRFLQQKFPGTTPNDWALGAEGLAAARGAAPLVIPFDADNATNSADILAIGKKTWERKFKDGKTLANCFPNGGKRVANTYPQYDSKNKQVVTLEMALNRCLQLHSEAPIDTSDIRVIGPLVAYFRSLAEGQKMAVRVNGAGAMDKFSAGKALFQRRIGQQNFACASCHVRNAGETFRNVMLSPVVGQAATWPRLAPGGAVRTLQSQFRLCMKRSGAEPFVPGSEELNDLEYYHTYLSNGMSISRLMPLPH